MGVDPVGSILADPDEVNPPNTPYKVEGIGYDFLPEVMNRSLVDIWVKTKDHESFTLARRLIKEEGLLCGGSCGSAMVGVLKAAKSLKAGQRCVVILPDSVRNYMSKFLNDGWMKKFGYVASEEPNVWGDATVADLSLNTTATTVSEQATCKEALEAMNSANLNFLPVLSESKKVVGLVSSDALFASKNSQSLVKPIMGKSNIDQEGKPVTVTNETKLEQVAKLLELQPAVVTTSTQVITKMDLTKWLFKQQ